VRSTRSANARTSVSERLDRPARHGVGQRPRDIREIAAQRAERVLVGLMQRRNLRVDVMELLLEAGQVLRRRPNERERPRLEP
jgi:hypothetical protein